MRDRLPHLQDLGVDLLWLTPFYLSPQRDQGYDIADHCAVDPRYGHLGDLDALLQDAHARGMRVLVDLVVNHTSDQHRWFQRSRSSREDPHRDFYVWRDPAPDGGPPNNCSASTRTCRTTRWCRHPRVRSSVLPPAG